MLTISIVDYNSDHDAAGHLISPEYGYLPTQSVNLVFITLFALSTGACSGRKSLLMYAHVETSAVHVVQAHRSRAWWLLPTVVLAGSGEVLGWIAREWSHDQPLNSNPFLMQSASSLIQLLFVDPPYLGPSP